MTPSHENSESLLHPIDQTVACKEPLNTKEKAYVDFKNTDYLGSHIFTLVPSGSRFALYTGSSSGSNKNEAQQILFKENQLIMRLDANDVRMLMHNSHEHVVEYSRLGPFLTHDKKRPRCVIKIYDGKNVGKIYANVYVHPKHGSLSPYTMLTADLGPLIDFYEKNLYEYTERGDIDIESDTDYLEGDGEEGAKAEGGAKARSNRHGNRRNKRSKTSKRAKAGGGEGGAKDYSCQGVCTVSVVDQAKDAILLKMDSGETFSANWSKDDIGTHRVGDEIQITMDGLRNGKPVRPRFQGPDGALAAVADGGGARAGGPISDADQEGGSTMDIEGGGEGGAKARSTMDIEGGGEGGAKASIPDQEGGSTMEATSSSGGTGTKTDPLDWMGLASDDDDEKEDGKRRIDVDLTLPDEEKPDDEHTVQSKRRKTEGGGRDDMEVSKAAWLGLIEEFDGIGISNNKN